MGSLVGKVEDSAWVDGISHVAGLEVQVRAGRTACVTTKSNGVASFYILVGLNEPFRQVAVDGLELIGVADNDIFAIR